MTPHANEFLTAADFAVRMTAIGGFEKRPHLAIAVSGGADSLALCLRAAGWARRRRGVATALVVDHGLRPGSSGEARQVAAWLAARDIPVQVLTWHGQIPDRAIQEAARRTRYRLMTDWCRDHGVLHLLLGHHQEDQAETVLMRLARGSGVDGLAAMSAVVETAAVRLLRPLLDVAPALLRETLRRRGQPWIEDPSNQDPRFSRARLRAARRELAEAGDTSPGLASAAQRFGIARQDVEHRTAEVLARSCRLDRAGFAHLRRDLIARASDDVALRALGRVIACVGGREHLPATDKVERLRAAVVSTDRGGARTLGGCRIVFGHEAILVCREARPSPELVAATVGASAMWDNRFQIAVAPGSRRRGLCVDRLGRHGWSHVIAVRPDLRHGSVPRPARPALPALWDDDGVVAVPRIGYVRDGMDATAERVTFRFSPPLALSPVGFVLA